MAQQQQQQQLDLGALSLEQLNSLKQQFNEELEMLTNSFQQLKVATAKYHELKEHLETLRAENEGKTAMIPLTSSLYVSGQLSDIEHVIIDIGTGYYVKKTIPEAKEFADRKLKVINDNVEQVQRAIIVKRKNLETVLMVMNSKITQQQQAEDKTAVKAQ